jgi:ABC-type antimicrobial peptide transport system permease subunit
MRLLPDVRRTVAALDDDQPVYMIQTLADAVGQSLFAERTAMVVLSVFGLLALALASLGVYGVQSFAVTSRTPEFGVRLALGASRGDVTRLVLRQAGLVILAGVLAGLAGAVALARLASGLLGGISPFDPLTFAAMGTAPGRRHGRGLPAGTAGGTDGSGGGVAE